uniref:hypothetical protein n=1 Tax=Roseivirga sp. TaxID=1964215 RepID=UPI0040476995
MPIPNLSSLYQRIHRGAEGGHEFARFIKMLLKADYESRGLNFISESDASGDFKNVDGYIPGDEELPNFITAFQYKFYPSNLSSSQKAEMIKSLEAALEENKFIQDYVFITPEDFLKEQQGWFESLKEKHEKIYWVEQNGISTKGKLELLHWGHSKIIELCLKHDHLGRQYFPELFPFGIGKFKLSKAQADSSLCNWLPSEYGTNRFYQNPMQKDDERTTDPVFDFQFKNSTSEIHLLNRIDIHIEKVWSRLRGIPQNQFLKSVGTIDCTLDFDKPINTISFANPMIFSSNEPMRFHLQLIDFVNKCPGNMATLKFWFHFDEITVPTDSFHLCF